MIEKLKVFYQSRLFPFIVITTLGLIAWLNPDTFLWRDDWLYLSFYYQGSYDFFKDHLASDIKPLFQYILFAEFYLGGLHFAFYQSLNAVLLILTSLCFFLILRSFSIHRDVALFCSLALLLHPVNFVNAFWIFQQGELFHVLFALLSVLYFKKYIDNHRSKTLFVFAFFLLTQNFLFPNGIFFSILFLFAYILMKPKGTWDSKFIVVVVLVFLVHISHALYIQTRMIKGEGMMQNILQKLNYFITLPATSLYRIAIPNFAPQSSLILNMLPLVVLIIFMIIFFKMNDNKEKRNAMLLSILGLIFSSIVLVLTRYNQPEIHYYYSALYLPFYFIIIAVLIDHLIRFNRLFRIGGSILILSGFLILDFKGKDIFASRNIRNLQQMESGLPNNRYYPFDDPCFLMEDYFAVSSYSQRESAVILYRSLSAQKYQKKK